MRAGAGWLSRSRKREQKKTRNNMSALITQTWELYLDAFPAWEIRVPKPTLQSITSIVYTDTDGILQTLAGSMYLVDNKSEPGRITPAFGEVWPVTRAQINAVIVRFVAA